MPSFSPDQLAAWTAGQWTGRPACVVAGFTHDTRALRPGEIFVALRTGKRDGHDFLAAAHAAGAAAAIVSRANPALPLAQLTVADPLAAFQAIARGHRGAFQAAGGVVIGISGSCGKTSTKNLLALMLSEAHDASRVLATGGNLNNHIGVPLTLTRLDPARHTHAVIEAGISAPGEMEALAAMIAPDHALITMIAPAHTQELGGIEGVAREKAVLLRHVRNNGARIFPESCLAYAPFRELPAAIPLNASQLSAFQPFSPSAFPSRGMAQNAALAIALASRLGVSEKQIQAALAAWRPAKWRGELFRDPGGRLLYLDLYNANPASMADALDAFASIAPAELPRLYVLGCMEELGPDAARHHRELGAQLRLRPQDEVFVIGTHAADVKAGAPAPEASRIEILDTLAPAAARVASFRGAIFLKGSRRYELEKALPPSSSESL